MTETAAAPTRRARPLPTTTTVVETSRITPELVRVVLHGDDWSRFGDPVDADAYVKLVFLTPGVEYARPIDPGRIRETMPADAWPRLRTYTVRAFDRAAGTLTLDIVTHGEGLAGVWAAEARPGDEMLVQGPGGGYSPDPTADWHLLAGDESALPAIAVALERLPSQARASVLIEVDGPQDETPLPSAAEVEVRWLYRAGGAPGSMLVDAVTAWTPPAGRGHLFVHGEAGAVKTLRRHLRIDRGLPLEQLSISGYWRQGADDEAWRSVKGAWNRAIDESEADAGI